MNIPQVTDVETEEASVAKTVEAMPTTPPSRDSADFFTAADGILNNLSQTLADKEKNQKLVSDIVATDAATVKPYLKIPIANEQVVIQAIDAFKNLLSAFKKT